MEIGQKLAALRNNAGLSQRSFAEKIGVSNGTVAMWETNKRQPDLETLRKIAEFYCVTTDSILGTNLSYISVPDQASTASTALKLDEVELLDLYNACDENTKRYLLAKVRVVAEERSSAVAAAEPQYLDKEKKSHPSSGTEGIA